jgi:hypothetical protein
MASIEGDVLRWGVQVGQVGYRRCPRLASKSCHVRRISGAEPPDHFLPLRTCTNSGGAKGLDAVQLRREVPSLGPKFVVSLQVHPELRRCSEVSSQPHRGVRSDATLSVDDLVDPAGWHPDRHGELVLRDAKALDEVLQENLTRVNRQHHVLYAAQVGSLPSVIVNELDLLRTRLGPHEADPPPRVDTDAVLALAITLESRQ